MLDVLHFYFEEDNTHASEESMKSQSALRVAVYKMYGQVYQYEYKGKQPKSPADYGYEPENATGSPYDTTVADKPFDPKTEPTKAYTPATDFDPEAAKPFGGVLDAPMG